MNEGAIELDRSLLAYLFCAATLITAGGIVAAVNSASPFGHGSWLAAYLVLVGGVSQVLLAGGRLALVRSRRSLSRARLVLWNFGSLGVPAGVLADRTGLVTAGSVALLCSLALFARGTWQKGSGGRGRFLAYLTVVAALASSVFVGSALAGAAPGAWL